MRRVQGVFASTHVDANGLRMTKEVLEIMARDIGRYYIPMGVEHDPRITPRGRVISGRVEQAADGEWILAGVGEEFEAGDIVPLATDKRELKIREISESSVDITVDRTFGTTSDREDLEKLKDTVSGQLDREFKQSLDPISVLQIAGVFLLGQVATGFLNKFGSDIWDVAKARISSLIARRRAEERDALVVFTSVVRAGDALICIDVVLLNPTGRDLDEFRSRGVRELDDVVGNLVVDNPQVRKLCFRFSEGRLHLGFALRRDGVPTSVIGLPP